MKAEIRAGPGSTDRAGLHDEVDEGNQETLDGLD